MAQSPPTVAVEAISDSSETDERPQNVLVNLTGTTGDRRLVREAGECARSTGGTLVLLSVMPSCEFAGRRESRRRAGYRRYTLCQAEEEGRRSAARVGRTVCSSLGIVSTVVGAVGSETDRVLAAAREHDCGHVFLVDRQPAGLRRLIGEDIVRTVTDGFDGLVTVLGDERRRRTGRWPSTGR